MAFPTLISSADTSTSIPLVLVSEASFPTWRESQPDIIQHWLDAHDYKGESGKTLVVPGTTGQLAMAIHGIKETPDIWTLAGLPAQLPPGDYAIEEHYDSQTATALMQGWLLGCYRYERYKEKKKPALKARLVAPESGDMERATQLAASVYLVRDLVNTPAEDMGPPELEAAARKLSEEFGAEFNSIVGDDLLDEGYPAIHAIGRAAEDDPRLLDLRWGSTDAPKVTLVGKGVCFDTGGLDIKGSANMRLMKKDMGGSAMVLGLARLIMATGIDIRLRVLIPAVENSISDEALRPGDVIRTRKGLSVEIGNTDAEGRVILCDALAEADSESPELIIDCATLTGAARVALGTDIPAIFSTHDDMATDLMRLGKSLNDPVWQLPLWEGYRSGLDSPIADLCNIAGGGYGGAITAALYLKEFVTGPWIHMDLMAWNLKDRPGRPVGGEAMGLRALYALICERFG